MRVCAVSTSIYVYTCIYIYTCMCKYIYIYVRRVIILLFFFFLENQSTKKKLIARFRIEPKRKHHSSWKRKKLIMIRRRRRWQTSTAIPCACFFFFACARPRELLLADSVCLYAYFRVRSSRRRGPRGFSIGPQLQETIVNYTHDSPHTFVACIFIMIFSTVLATDWFEVSHF